MRQKFRCKKISRASRCESRRCQQLLRHHHSHIRISLLFRWRSLKKFPQMRMLLHLHRLTFLETRRSFQLMLCRQLRLMRMHLLQRHRASSMHLHARMLRSVNTRTPLSAESLMRIACSRWSPASTRSRSPFLRAMDSPQHRT